MRTKIVINPFMSVPDSERQRERRKEKEKEKEEERKAKIIKRWVKRTREIKSVVAILSQKMKLQIKKPKWNEGII